MNYNEPVSGVLLDPIPLHRVLALLSPALPQLLEVVRRATHHLRGREDHPHFQLTVGEGQELGHDRSYPALQGGQPCHQVGIMSTSSYL